MSRYDERALIDAFIEALSVRPDEFEPDDHGGPTIYSLRDKATGHCWWVANADYGFKLRLPGWPPRESPIHFGWWQRRRAWRAFKRWRVDHYDPPRILAVEAEKIATANRRPPPSTLKATND